MGHADMVLRGKHVMPAPPDDATAARRTEDLVSLMPRDLKGSGVSVKDFAGFEEREDCKALLKEITRAVPARLLLDDSLHKADDKAKLKASHFFLSNVVDQLQGFLSHRWRSNPQETADALMLHFKLRFFLFVLLAEWAVGLLLFMTFTPLAWLTSYLCQRLRLLPYSPPSTSSSFGSLAARRPLTGSTKRRSTRRSSALRMRAFTYSATT